ncbi:MAG: hypothetical protein AAGF87_08760 [Bacteroidota bacterium]
MYKQILIIPLAFCTFLLNAQYEQTLLGDLDLSGAWGGITYNYSDYGDDWALVRGGYGGVEFGNTFFVGYGGWRLKDEVLTEEGRQEFKLRHGGFVLAYTPASYRSVHPRASFIFGPGRVWTLEDGERDRVFVLQPAAGLELNIFQAMRLGVEGGYRYVGNVNLGNVTSQDASGFFLQIELRFGFSW